MEDGEAKQLANQRGEKMEQMAMMMASAEGQSEQRNSLYVDGLFGEPHRGHQVYAMIEQKDLAHDETGKVFVRKVRQTVVLDQS